MAELSEAERALLADATLVQARIALQQIQETGNTQRQQAARARMTGRTIDETGRDISEQKPEPEQIKTGWYWTGRYVVWVVGPTVHGRSVHYQTAVSGIEWTPMRNTSSWQRVHEAVKESGQGFGWHPLAQNH